MSCIVIKYPNNSNVKGTFTPSGLQNGGLVTQVTLNTVTWTPLPLTPLANRNAINIQNYSGDDIVIQYDNTVAGFDGVLMRDQSERNYDIKETILLYAKSKTGGATITVEEIS